MEITCNTCGDVFEAKRSDARYCSPKCRTAAHRKSHGIITEPRRRRPLPDSARDLGWDLYRLAGRIDRLVEDDRLARNADEVAAVTRHGARVLREALDRLDEALQRHQA